MLKWRMAYWQEHYDSMFCKKGTCGANIQNTIFKIVSDDSL